MNATNQSDIQILHVELRLSAEVFQTAEYPQIQRDADARQGSSEKEGSHEAESGLRAAGAATPLAFSATDSSEAFFWNETGASAPRREIPLWFLPDSHPVPFPASARHADEGTSLEMQDPAP